MGGGLPRVYIIPPIKPLQLATPPPPSLLFFLSNEWARHTATGSAFGELDINEGGWSSTPLPLYKVLNLNCVSVSFYLLKQKMFVLSAQERGKI